MLEPKVLCDPWIHAFRGLSASFAGVTLLTNVMGNRRAILSLRPTLSNIQIIRPSRSAIAIAVFVGIFRVIERLKVYRCQSCTSTTVDKAAFLASMCSILCVHPKNRTPIIALLTTNAISQWFQQFARENPYFSKIKHADFVAFLTASGWIVYSSLIEPTSYEPLHLKLIMKYTLISKAAATYLQDNYAAGINASPCQARHPNETCTHYMLHNFIMRVVRLGLRLYLPVHFTSWLLLFRHRAVRSKPLMELFHKFVIKLVRSVMYFIGFILTGWSMMCYSRYIGERSLASRKFHLFACGFIPALSILFESPRRRRPIAVILCSYAFVSMGTVLSRKRPFWWLQQGSGLVRTGIDVICFASSMTYTIIPLLSGSVLLKRVLFGSSKIKKSKPQQEIKMQKRLTEQKISTYLPASA